MTATATSILEGRRRLSTLIVTDEAREAVAKKRDELLPRRLPSADWQAGITPGNQRFKVQLNGETLPLAFAASATNGWVKVYDDRHRVDVNDLVSRDSFGRPVVRTLHGKVAIVPGDAPMWKDDE